MLKHIAVSIGLLTLPLLGCTPQSFLEKTDPTQCLSVQQIDEIVESFETISCEADQNDPKARETETNKGTSESAE